MRERYSLQSFSAGHFFHHFTSEDSFYCKKFFGGLSVYVYGRMVAFLCEHSGDKTWRGKEYPTELWNGCLIPTHRDHHEQLLGKLKGVCVHPVITKWLYLPVTSFAFEDSMFQLIELIEKRSELIGVEPEIRVSRQKPQVRSVSRKTVKRVEP